MNEIEMEDKEKIVRKLWEELSHNTYSAARQENAELKRMAGDEKGYGFSYDELCKLQGKERKEKILDIVHERYIGSPFAMFSGSEYNDVMDRIFHDAMAIDFTCALHEITKKFAFQKTRRLHYNKRTKKYYFT